MRQKCPYTYDPTFGANIYSMQIVIHIFQMGIEKATNGCFCILFKPCSYDVPNPIPQEGVSEDSFLLALPCIELAMAHLKDTKVVFARRKKGGPLSWRRCDAGVVNGHATHSRDTLKKIISNYIFECKHEY